MFKSLLGRLAGLERESALMALLAPFFLVFLVCAVVFQLMSGEPPRTSATVVDRFSSGLLWAGSVVALLLAVEKRREPRTLVGWLIVCAGAGGLAIDEVVELHERTMQVVGEDDYSKIVIWLAAVVGVTVILRAQRDSSHSSKALIIGLVLHTAYLLTDLGDGDFFQLPLDSAIADWVEEILEILALQAYVASMLFRFASTRQPQEHDTAQV